MPRRALLLINPRARLGAAGLPQALRCLREHGFDLLEVQDNAAIRQHHDGADLVIVGGGDGTLNRAVDVLVELRLPLGVLPLGTANDLARTLGLPNDLTEACRVIAEGHTRAIDLGWVNGKHFFNVASVGLSVALRRRLSQSVKGRWGILAYPLTALRALWLLWNARPFHVEIRAGGEILHGKTVQLAIGNGVYYGGGLTIAADAAIDDQRLDLYSLQVQHWWQVVPLLPALRSGTLAGWPNVLTRHGQAFAIHTRRPRSINTDGEITTRTPAEFRVVPRALTVLVP